MPRGFAAMTPEQRTILARKGGKAAHAAGKAHRFTSEEAREAGKKGGTKSSQNSDRMAFIGSKGGKASRRGPKKKAVETPEGEGTE